MAGIKFDYFEIPHSGGRRLFFDTTAPEGHNKKGDLWVDLANVGSIPHAYTGSAWNMGAYIVGAAAGYGLKVHTHSNTTEWGNEFKGEFTATSGTMDGIAAHYHMAGSGTGIMRSILGVAYLDTGITLSGTNFSTGSWLVGGLFSANVAGIVNGTGACVAGIYGGVGFCVGGTLTAAKYITSIWGDSQRLVALSSGISSLLLLTNQTGCQTIDYGIDIIADAAITTGINLTGDTSTGIKISGGVTGTGIYIDKAANTGGTLKIHCHQAAAGVEYANEFKGEFLSASGTMDGIAAHYHMSASGTGVLRSILGVAYLDTGITLSGTAATGSWINGVLGSVSIAGVLNGTAVTVTGVYGGLGSMVGGTLTACKYMSAIWADSQVTQVPTSGESQLLLMTNGLGATLNQAIYMDANDRISEFAHFVNCATMISAKTDADVAYAHYRKLLCTVDGNPGWIYIEMAS